MGPYARKGKQTNKQTRNILKLYKARARPVLVGQPGPPIYNFTKNDNPGRARAFYNFKKIDNPDRARASYTFNNIDNSGRARAFYNFKKNDNLRQNLGNGGHTPKNKTNTETLINWPELPGLSIFLKL